MSEHNDNKHIVTANFVSVTQPATYGKYTKVEMTAKIVDGQYTNWVVFDVSGKTMDMLLENMPNEGDKLNISFALSGRYSDKYKKVFNGNRAFFIRNLSKSSSAQGQAPVEQNAAPQQSVQQAPQSPIESPAFETESEDPVPF